MYCAVAGRGARTDCNVDRVYESVLNTVWGKDFQQEWYDRWSELGRRSGPKGFPQGEWGPYEPFGINPKTGAQYECKDTFDTASLGYMYNKAQLYQPTVGGVELLMEMPALALFEAVEKRKIVGGAKV